MSPARRERWFDGDRPYAPRISVEGGARVARPGSVTTPAAFALVEAAVRRTSPGIGSRARTYARQGQVVELRVEDGAATAAVQGSDAEPYAVGLVRSADGDVEASCSCPYGCDAVEWCKHAAALAYVVADLVDRDAGVADRWLGAGSGDEADEDDTAPDPAEVEALAASLEAVAGPPPAAQRWAAAFEVLPPPR